MILKEGQNLNFAIPVERLRDDARIAITIPSREREKITRLVTTYLDSLNSDAHRLFTDPVALDRYCTLQALQVAQQIAVHNSWPERTFSFESDTCRILLSRHRAFDLSPLAGGYPEEYSVEQTFKWLLTNGKKHQSGESVFMGTVIKVSEGQYMLKWFSGLEPHWLDPH